MSRCASLGLFAATIWSSPVVASAEGFVQFESGPVRPVALSPDSATLAVANIPDGYLEIIELTEGGLVHVTSISVGLDPVAVAFRSDSEVWVVNHLSDSVSIVDLSSASVVRTLLVGDEPRDIVFARGRAFVTTAHRGQRRTAPELAGVPGSGDPSFTAPGVGRADVWVFDAEAPGDTPIAITSFFGDTPRALAVSPDESTVYVAVFNSGNGTTTIPEGAVCDGFEAAGPCTVDGALMPGGNPGPSTNVDGDNAPEVGLIVKHDPDTQGWRDELGRDWSDALRFDLPDYDVFALDVGTLEPAGSPVPRVGTTLFNMAVNPVSGELYVTNTDAQNHVRFEGPGTAGGSTVQGDLARARISVVDVAGGSATPVALNPHIDYAQRPASPEVADKSLATPLDVAISGDGSTLYVAAYGSARVGVRSTAALDAGGLEFATSGGGPAGLALDEDRGRLYVYTRFDNAIAAHSLADGGEVDKLQLHTPEPQAVIDGRAFLYDAPGTSSNGEASCSACHIFGDVDHLAWDLGNPDGSVKTGTISIKMEPGTGTNINGTGNAHDFHPMKGPMTTQTLRGLQFSGAQHWRGDRSVGPAGNHPTDAETSFLNFIEAFAGLIGREREIEEAQMHSFSDFAFSIAPPPNPVRNLDNTLTARQQAALDFYASQTRIAVGVQVPNFGFTCEGCHALHPEEGFFGTRGDQGFSNQPQIFKVPHLRSMVSKVGMFGMVAVTTIRAGNNEHQGQQIRGFGYLHDGSVDSLFRFLTSTQFDAAGDTIGFQSDAEREDMVALLLAFDADVAPVVGQQLTVHGSPTAAERARFGLLLDASVRPYPSKLFGINAPECDLVAKLDTEQRVRGYVLQDGMFTPDDESASLSADALLAAAETGALTVSAVLPGTGVQRGIDRDLDGAPDGLDDCPADPQRTAECEDPGEPPHPGGSDSGSGETGDPAGQDSPTPDGCGCRNSAPRVGPLGLALWLLVGSKRRRFVTHCRPAARLVV